MDDTAADIRDLLRRHLVSGGEVERLVSWIALRLGRAPALAGDRPPLDRLDHVVRHWLDPTQRVALHAWLVRRLDQGRVPVPDADPRRLPLRSGPGGDTSPTGEGGLLSGSN